MSKIIIPIVPSLTPRQQIDEALAKLSNYYCPRHSHVILEQDHGATYEAFLDRQWTPEELLHSPERGGRRHRYTFVQAFKRCPHCPYDQGGEPLDRYPGDDGSPCAASGNTPLRRIQTADGHLPAIVYYGELNLDLTLEQQYHKWLAETATLTCAYASEPIALVRSMHHCKRVFPDYHVGPVFKPCPQCWLESKGIQPHFATASFENFRIEPQGIRGHWETCKAFADQPRGNLILLGSAGNGKTHLAISAMRERFRRGYADAIFIKQRHFLQQHWEFLRPAGFREAKPEGIMKPCQKAGLLIFDEMREATSNRDIEDSLLDLFEYRIGHHLPSIITANLTRAELEPAIGSRLLDRLRQADFAVLEFNFPSVRARLAAEYLTATATAHNLQQGG